jgi:hypothetical protein
LNLSKKARINDRRHNEMLNKKPCPLYFSAADMETEEAFSDQQKRGILFNDLFSTRI